MSRHPSTGNNIHVAVERTIEDDREGQDVTMSGFANWHAQGIGSGDHGGVCQFNGESFERTC